MLGAHPVTFGTKALYRSEGKTVIPNMLLSLFLGISRQVVHDFACGLQSSAKQILWGAIQENTVCADIYNVKNHNYRMGSVSCPTSSETVELKNFFALYGTAGMNSAFFTSTSRNCYEPNGSGKNHSNVSDQTPYCI